MSTIFIFEFFSQKIFIMIKQQEAHGSYIANLRGCTTAECVI